MGDSLDVGAVVARLEERREQAGLSMREVSLKSGNSPGYYHSIVKDGKEPTIGRLAEICRALGVSLSYILYGVNISSETEEVLRHIEENPGSRDHILGLIRSR